MTTNHYNKSFDTLTELEQTINEFPHLRYYLLYVQEKAKNGEDVQAYLSVSIGIFDYLMEKFDKQFPEVWHSVITQHPSLNHYGTT